MKIFISGATGLVGRYALREALRAGAQVTVLARDPSRLPEDLRDRVRVIQGSLAGGKVLEEALAGHEAVLNCAGVLSAAGSEEFTEGNVRGPRELYRAARESGAACFVQVGSMGVYGLDTSGPLSETTVLEPHPSWRGDYTSSKLEGERGLIEDAGAAGLPLLILRPAVVYGSGRPLPLGRLGWKAAGKAVVCGSGSTLLPLVYAGNLATALIRACALRRSLIVNIVDEPGLTQRVFFETWRRVDPSAPRPLFLPASPFIAAAKVYDAANRLAGRGGHLAYRFRRTLTSVPLDVSRSAAELGYAPAVPLDRALKESLGR